MNDNELQVLLDQPFVLVGVNYRLGPLGWLSLGCKEAPGNLGLWDQQLALRWVQDHISAFGGDPSSVTLMGESAGAMCAMLHMAAPSRANLFHQVVALSGTPSNPLLRKSRKPAAYAIYQNLLRQISNEKPVSKCNVLLPGLLSSPWKLQGQLKSTSSSPTPPCHFALFDKFLQSFHNEKVTKPFSITFPPKLPFLLTTGQSVTA